MVSAVDQPFLRKGPVEQDMSRLAMGMDACVCAARAMKLESFSDEIADSFLDHLLHGQSVFLPLPASIGSSEIGQSQTIVCGSRFHFEEINSAKNGTQMAR